MSEETSRPRFAVCQNTKHGKQIKGALDLVDNHETLRVA
jgi:hypothetical protein